MNDRYRESAEGEEQERRREEGRTSKKLAFPREPLANRVCAACLLPPTENLIYGFDTGSSLKGANSFSPIMPKSISDSYNRYELNIELIEVRG